MPNRLEDLKGLRLLVVEDVLVEAEEICREFESCGCEIIGPTGRIGRAVTLAQEASLDGAVLDVNLGGYMCFPVAEVLAGRGIPFIFITGYWETVILPEYRDVPCLKKPFGTKHLLEFVARHIAAESLKRKQPLTRRVLVAEDYDDFVPHLCEFLSGNGFLVACAGRFGEASALLGKEHFDLLVANVRLPDGRGTGLARVARLRGTKVLFITGHPGEMELMENTNTPYLPKPFSPSLFTERVRRMFPGN